MSDTTIDPSSLSAHDEPTRAEPDKVNMTFVAVFVAALLLILVVLVVGILNFFTLQTQAMLKDKVYSVVDPEIQRVRVQESERLNDYRWVDESKGVVQIPVNRALELTRDSWEARVDAANALAAAEALEEEALEEESAGE